MTHPDPPPSKVEAPIKSLHEALARSFEPSVREVDDDDEKDPVSPRVPFCPVTRTEVSPTGDGQAGEAQV